MTAKGIHHIGITVNNWEKSAAFYYTLAEALGARPFIDNLGAPHRREDGKVIIFVGEGFMFSLWEAFDENKANTFKDYNIGLHHFAFDASSREDVDALYEKMKAIGAEIVDAPQEYDYVPGYYAVFFRDPEGIRIEYAYVPA